MTIKERHNPLIATLEALERELRAAGKEPREEAASAMNSMKTFELQSLCDILYGQDHIERILFINDEKYQIFRVVKLHGEPLFGILSHCKGSRPDEKFTMRMECLTKVALDIQIESLEADVFVRATPELH